MTPLLRTRRFLPLFLTQFCGAFNDNLLKNSLVILVTYRSVTIFGIPPEQMVALAGGIFILPYFLFSATAGQIADRYDKARVIMWVKISEVTIMVLSAAGFLLPHFPFLLGSLFLMGVHSTFFGPLKYSILPQHLHASELMAGNAWVEAGTFVAILLGTICGGVLISLPGGPFWVSVGLMSVAFFGLASSRFIPSAPSFDTTLKPQWNLVTPTINLLKLTLRERYLFRVILAISWFWYFGATVLSLFPLLGKNVIHTDESIVTLFLAIFSVGVGVGSILCGRISHHKATVGIALWGLLGMALFSVVVYFGIAPLAVSSQSSIGLSAFLNRDGAWILLTGLLGMAVSGGVFIVPLYTLMQERSSPAVRSRIIAGNNIINAIFMVTAAVVLAAALKHQFSVEAIFLILAAANGVAVLFLYRIE